MRTAWHCGNVAPMRADAALARLRNVSHRPASHRCSARRNAIPAAAPGPPSGTRRSRPRNSTTCRSAFQRAFSGKAKNMAIARWATHQVPCRDQPRRRDCRGPRHLRRRCECRGAARSARRARWDLHVANGARADPGQAALSVRGYRRAERQEHCSPRARLCIALRSRRRSAEVKCASPHGNSTARRCATPVDCSAPVYQSERRHGATIFRGWDH